MIHCRLDRGPAPCIDDLCHGGSWTLCGLDMDFEEEMERQELGDEYDDEYDDEWDADPPKPPEGL